MNTNQLIKLLSAFFFIILIGCHGHFAVDPPKGGKYKSKPVDFNHGYNDVWSAAISSLEDMGWDIKKLDRDKGEIHLQTSFVYTPSFDVLSRIYVEPLNQDIEKSYIIPYLRSISYYEKTTEMDPRFTRENLKLVFTSVNDSHTQVKPKYKIEPYYSYKIGYIGSVRSNGEFESNLLSRMDDILNMPVAELPPPPPVPVDYNLNLKDIFFDYNKFDIREDAAPILSDTARIIKNNPDYTILIESYADIRGTDKYNLTLAQNRADMTKQFLVQSGIKSEKIIAVGKGETEIFGEGKTKEIYQLNRRSVFRHTKPLMLDKYFSYNVK